MGGNRPVWLFLAGASLTDFVTSWLEPSNPWAVLTVLIALGMTLAAIVAAARRGFR